jgi:hypothetical protein
MRVDFDRNTGKWFAESPIALGVVEKSRVIKFVQHQLQLRINKEEGAKRKRMQESLNSLTPESLEVRLIGKGEKTLYLDPSEKY